MAYGIWRMPGGTPSLHKRMAWGERERQGNVGAVALPLPLPPCPSLWPVGIPVRDVAFGVIPTGVGCLSVRALVWEGKKPQGNCSYVALGLLTLPGECCL